jgi:CHAT domain-containing protein/Tfp pilus assembly protein PilF
MAGKLPSSMTKSNNFKIGRWCCISFNGSLSRENRCSQIKTLCARLGIEFMGLTLQLSHLEAILAALAVVGEADVDLLEYVLEAHLDEPIMAQLRAVPGISTHNHLLVMAADAASTRLKALEEGDFLHFRLLHQRAATRLAQRLVLGESKVEPAFMVVFTRLAEHLRHQDPTRLPALIEAVAQAPLADPHNQHYRSYMEGISLQQTGHYHALLQLCDTLLKQPDLTLALRGRTHNLRATSFYFLGRLQQALDDYRAGLAIMQQIGNHLSAGIVLQNMGALAYDLQDYAEAEARLHQAAAIFAHEGSVEWMAAVQNELGLVYRDQGKWAQAARSFAEFIAGSEEHGAEDDVAIGLLNLGDVMFFQGDFAAAETKLRAALAKMSTDAFRMEVLLVLGMIRQLNGDLAEAESLYQLALALTTQLGRRFMLAAVHYRLASLCRQRVDVDGALHHLLAAINVVEETRVPLREEGLKISLLGRWQQLYEAMVLHLVEQQNWSEAFHYVERARSRAFLDMFADVQATDDTSGAGMTADAPLTLAEVQANLPENAALVEFYATGQPGAWLAMLANIPPTAQFLRALLLPPERLLAFVVTRQALQVIELDANSRQIEAQHFHRADGRLRGLQPLPGQPLRTLSRWPDLAARLLLPLRPYIEGKQHLFFVPHGVLHYLPLHALTMLEQVTGSANTTVSYGPSASILFKQVIRRQNDEPLRMLAIGVDGGGLFHAEAEAQWIARQLQGETLLGAQATCAVVRQALPEYAVIHFSCHGHFRQHDAWASSLALADGELTALDLMHSGRLKADLVTLSACDTGLNELHPGDELMGLTRAFLGSGARSLLVTLWPVYELPTRLFVEHFYQSWRAGVSKAAALASAQRHLMGMNRATLEKALRVYGLDPAAVAETMRQFEMMLPGEYPFAHPYYWGAFLLMGDPQ